MKESPYPDPYAEVREYFRLTVSLPVDYQLEGEEAQGPPKLISLNLSGGGVGFTTKRQFDLGDTLALTIMIPLQPALVTKAKIVRVAPLEIDETTFLIGAKFTVLDNKDRERIQRYLFNVQRERRRERYNV